MLVSQPSSHISSRKQTIFDDETKVDNTIEESNKEILNNEIQKDMKFFDFKLRI